MIRCAIAIAAATCLCAQINLSGVRSGHVADESARVLRPVIGMPGAAYLGAAIPLPFSPVSAQSAAGGLLLVSDMDEAWLARDLDRAQPSAGKLASASAVFAAPGASSAVLYASREGAFRLAYGLDKTAAAGPAIDELVLRGTFRTAAIDEGSGCALLLSLSEAETFLYRLCPARPAEPVLIRAFPAMDIAAAAYSARQGLLLADRGGSRVVLVRNPVESGALQTLAAGLPSLAGVQPSGTSHAIAVSADPARAWVIDVQGKAAPVPVDLPLPPEKLEFLTPGGILVCNRLREGPLLVIDLGQDRSPFLIPAPWSPE